jgi:hypothetical protein
VPVPFLKGLRRARPIRLSLKKALLIEIRSNKLAEAKPEQYLGSNLSL